MAQVMRDSKLDMRLRLDAAKALAAVLRQPAGGKKEQQAKTAQTVAAGRFGARPAPLKVVGGRGS